MSEWMRVWGREFFISFHQRHSLSTSLVCQFHFSAHLVYIQQYYHWVYTRVIDLYNHRSCCQLCTKCCVQKCCTKCKQNTHTFSTCCTHPLTTGLFIIINKLLYIMWNNVFFFLSSARKMPCLLFQNVPYHGSQSKGPFTLERKPREYNRFAWFLLVFSSSVNEPLTIASLLSPLPFQSLDQYFWLSLGQSPLEE